MARFTHAVTLDAVPQQWFNQLVRAVHDQAEGELSGGDVKFTARSWDPRVESVGELSFADETMGLACEFALRSAARPVTFECAGQVRLPEDQPSFLRTVSWTVSADLNQWWRSAGRITGVAQAKLAKGEVRLVPTRIDSNQWQLEVITKLRGKGLARPFVAIALLAARAKVDRHLVEILREVETRWHDEVPPLLRRDPANVVKEVLLKVPERPVDDPSDLR